ncbi:MAG TPA: VOC family protein [Anaeromyxobacteraceae bacterium]|nr:VOC family protein [Anaeromyxobacteraceae bacterium]
MAKPSPIPAGRHSVTPNLILSDCGRAIDFYKRALGAEEVGRFPSPDGKSVWHAELRIGDSIVYAADEMPGRSAKPPAPDRISPVGFWIWTADCDAAHRRAVDAGGRSKMPPTDMFWGDRTATVEDPYGYSWTFATHVKDMTREEMEKAGREFAKQMGMTGKG